jgi:hypothetical protein
MARRLDSGIDFQTLRAHARDHFLSDLRQTVAAQGLGPAGHLPVLFHPLPAT